MATIGKAVIQLEAQSAEFTKGVNKATGDLDGFSAKINNLTGLHVDLGALFNVAAVVELAANAAEAIEKVGEVAIEAGHKVAEWVGESLHAGLEQVNLARTLGYSVETLGALRDAVEDSGGSAEALDGGLEKLTKTIGEAATEGGAGAAALQRLGLSAKTLAQMSGDQQIRAIADGLQTVQNTAERARIVVELFGRSGLQLMPAFREGAAGIDDAVANGLKLGNVMTTLQASRLAAANASVRDLSDAFDGVKNSLTIALAPTIASVAESIVGLLPPADRLQSAFTTAFNTVAQAGGKVLDVLAPIAAYALRVEAGYLRVDALFVRITSVVAELEGRVGRWVESLPLVGSIVQGVADIVIGIGKAIVASVEWVWAKVQAINNLLASVHLTNPVAQVQGKAADGLTTAADMMTSAADALDKTSFSDKASKWLDGIHAKSDASAKDLAETLDNAGAALGSATDAQAAKVSAVLDKMRADAAQATAAAVQAANAAGTPIKPPMIDTGNVRIASDALSVLHSQADAIATAKPGELIDLDRLHASVEQMAEGKALLATINGQPGTDGIMQFADAVRAAGATAAEQTADQSKKAGEVLDKLRSDVASIGDGRPKELVDLTNLHASNDQLREASALLDAITHQKIGDEIAKLATQVQQFGLSDAQKQAADLRSKGANDAELARAKTLADQFDLLKQQKTVSDDMAKLMKDASQAGLTNAQKQLADLRDKGATAEQLKQATLLQQQIDRFDALKKDQQEATQLIDRSATPLQKYQNELDKIQRLYAEGLLTQGQQADALAKASNELGKASKANDDRHVGAQTLRFDFKLPTEPKHLDVAAQALRVQQQQLDSQKRAEYYQQQLYQFGLSDQQNADVVVDF